MYHLCANKPRCDCEADLMEERLADTIASMNDLILLLEKSREITEGESTRTSD
jgi:hypothetical protein